MDPTSAPALEPHRDALASMLLSQMPAVLWSVDRDLRFTLSVGAALAGLDLEPAEVVGRTLFEYFGTSDPEFQPIAQHRRALGGTPCDFEMPFKGRVFEVRLAPLTGPAGAVTGVLGIALDVTAKKSTENEVRAREERYRSMVESALDAVLTIDEKSTILFANLAVERIFGHKVEDVIGKKLTMLMPTALRESHEAGLARYKRSGSQRFSWTAIEFPGLHKEGREIPLEISFTETVKDGRRTFTGILRDVSERKLSDHLRSALYRVAETTAGHGDLPKFYAALHRIVGRLMHARNFYIALHDPRRHRLVFPYWVDERDPAPGSVPEGRSLTDYVFRRGEALLATPEVFDRLVAAGEVDSVGAPSVDWLGAPLRSGDATFGVIVVQSYSRTVRFKEADKEVLNFVSRHLASAIEKKRAEEALEEWKDRYEAATLASGQILYDWDVPADVFTWGGNGESVLGFTNDALPVTYADRRAAIHADDRAAFAAEIDRVLATREPFHLEYRLAKSDGTYTYVRDDGAFMFEADGKPHRMVGFLVDITQRKSLEEELRHSQKMEAIGRLAGGVAHDFNNVLMVILSYCDLLQSAGGGPEVQEGLQEIKKAGQRAAALTNQLLAFSRKQMLAPRVLDLNALVLEMEGMLRRVIGEDIELRTNLARGLGTVRADPGQLEHVLMNLAVNARDAMPKGGLLTIETGNVTPEADWLREHGARSAAYVMLAVTDTGVGMDEETRARIFEPFFTTKEKGRGTGLGLSTCYGIVKQSGGEIIVETSLGHGTRLTILLPRAAQTVEVDAYTTASRVRERGQETILLAEDEPAVATLAQRALERNGYTVLTARNAAEALEISGRQPGTIHLLLTDVVMPGGSGRELATHLTGLRPDIKVLYMSGHTDDAIVRHGLRQKGLAFLQKPFGLDDLLDAVRGVLDGR